MPSGSINLRDPRLVITVAVLLTAVAVINVKTFWPRRASGPVAQWQDDSFVMPEDTADLTRAANAQVTGAAGAPGMPVAMAGGQGAAGTRDPFRQRRTPAAAPRPATAPRTIPTRPRTRVEPPPGPVCTAVLLGDGPVAFIDGKARHLGDLIAGQELVSIDPDGAVLRGPRGDIRLPVGNRADDPTRYPLVTNSRAGMPGTD